MSCRHGFMNPFTEKYDSLHGGRNTLLPNSDLFNVSWDVEDDELFLYMKEIPKVEKFPVRWRSMKCCGSRLRASSADEQGKKWMRTKDFICTWFANRNVDKEISITRARDYGKNSSTEVIGDATKFYNRQSPQWKEDVRSLMATLILDGVSSGC